jgi:hypothetical protein
MKNVLFILSIPILFFVFNFGIPEASAAVTIDATSTHGIASTCSSCSWTHTPNANASSVIVFGHTGGQTISSATYGAVNLNPITDVVANRAYVRGAVNAPADAQTITITMGGTDHHGGGAVGLLGVDKTSTSTLIGAIATSSCSACTSLSKAITTLSDDSLNLDVFTTNDVGTSVVVTGTNQTMIWKDDTNNNAYGSQQTTGAAGSYTMSWSWTGSDSARIAIVEVEEEAVAAAEEGVLRRRIIIIN